MTAANIGQLASGYTSETDTVDEVTWCALLQRFADANVYQTWAYSAVRHGQCHTSHLILKKDGEIVAIVQATVKRLPLLGIGIAHVRWGPLWKQPAKDPDPECFRQAVRALRNEYAGKRGLVLRLVPNLYLEDSIFAEILAEEGFQSGGAETRSSTIVMDLSPPLEVLREGMKAHWKRELKIAERKGLEIVEGSDDSLFAAFIPIYREMVRRKKFVEGNDVGEFRRMQAQLPPELKMNVMLCSLGGAIVAGAVWSAMGNTALYLFGATGDAGVKSNGSYLLQWKLIERVKEQGCVLYDLNGINPATNPGTFKFKDDLAGKNGRQVAFVGCFEARPAGASAWCVGMADRLRTAYRSLNQKWSRRNDPKPQSQTRPNQGEVTPSVVSMQTRSPLLKPAERETR